MRQVLLVGVLAAAVAALAAAPAMAQTEPTSLGSVRLTRAVTANGERLPAGTYTVRLTGNALDPATGQSAQAEQWVEFVQGGQVRGREVVTVIPDTEIAEVAEGPRPRRGGSRVELLKGEDYVRVWINRGGANYLIHMPPA
ncbi:MAG TPA: hypothetical protein VF136_10765 [Methylomirabilota bacterium]